MRGVSDGPLLSQPPTRVRYGVLAFACSLSMLTYLDRVCFASAQSWIIDDLGLESEADLKWVFTAFALAYSLFEVPSGWLGDVFGPRSVLIRIVLWWSAFTAITGLIGMSAGGHVLGGLASMFVVRFLFGMGEAGAYPNITRALHNWFPYSERGFAQGAVWMSGRLMGGLTSLIWTGLMFVVSYPVAQIGASTPIPLLPLHLQWRAPFWLFGAIGVVWCLLFALWFRNRPEEKTSVNAAELALIRGGGAGPQAGHSGIPWRRILASRNLWWLCLMYACQAYGWYFYITYLPRFLEEQHDLDPKSYLGAIYKGGPLWLGAVGCLLGGFLTDWFIRRTGNRRLGRKVFGILGHGLGALCFLAVYLLESGDTRPDAFWFFLAISLAGFVTDMTMGSAWAVCQDIGKRYAAIVAGFMNMIGNLGGAVASWMSGYVLEHALQDRAQSLAVTVEALKKLPAMQAEKTAALLQGYQVNFLMFAGALVIGVICWTQIDSTKAVTPDE